MEETGQVCLMASFPFRRRNVFNAKRRIMKRIGPLLFILTLSAWTHEGQAQGPGVSLGFHNDTKSGVLVQGFTNVNGTPRAGKPFLVTPGKTGFDNNVPSGMIRFINIVDSAQPNKVLLWNAPIQVFKSDLMFSDPSPAQVAGDGNPRTQKAAKRLRLSNVCLIRARSEALALRAPVIVPS